MGIDVVGAGPYGGARRLLERFPLFLVRWVTGAGHQCIAIGSESYTLTREDRHIRCGGSMSIDPASYPARDMPCADDGQCQQNHEFDHASDCHRSSGLNRDLIIFGTSLQIFDVSMELLSVS
jgi:hypothetical protein